MNKHAEESKKDAAKNIGDMPAEEFRKYGHELIDWIAEYLSNIESYSVVPKVKPGEIKSTLSKTPPQKGEPFNKIIDDFDKKIIPGITHWNHPGFMAYFNSTSSGPGILAELLSSALNVNGMLWKTSPSATELEQITTDWMRQMIGLPENFWGIIYDTASVSTMHAIAAAREDLNLNLREKGLPGRNEVPRLRIYASEHVHSSIDKAVITLGLGLESLRKINTDDQFKLKPEELKKVIAEDKQNGWLPFCVVATIGTTSITSIDPVEDIAKICKEEHLWLHVDAAHAGIAAIVPEMKYIIKGAEFADSFVVNPHKWMFTPIDLSLLYTTKKDVLKQGFSLVAEYLKTKESGEVENYMDYGIQLGRRFRSLKLWFIIRYFGIDGITERIREHLRLAKDFSNWIDNERDLERMAPVPLSTICFRAHPKNINKEDELNKLNEELMNKINSKEKIFLTHTKLYDKFVIRLVISGLRTQEEHVNNAKQIIRESLSELLKK
jgi:aromatic-L-amino-acid/L-tryptophan decarboxylase